MAFIRDWEKEAKQMTEEKRKEIIKALDVLDAWPMFRNEYAESGLQTIKTILEYTDD